MQHHAPKDSKLTFLGWYLSNYGKIPADGQIENAESAGVDIPRGPLDFAAVYLYGTAKEIAAMFGTNPADDSGMDPILGPYTNDGVTVVFDWETEQWLATLNNDIQDTTLPARTDGELYLTIDLNNYNITGSNGTEPDKDGKTALTVNTGYDVEVIGPGKIIGGNGADSATGDDGKGGIGIDAQNKELTLRNGVIVCGGQGGDGAPGENGGNGGTGDVENNGGTGTITGGDGGDSDNGSGGSGGSGVDGNVGNNGGTGTITGGNGGDSDNGSGGSGGSGVTGDVENNGGTGTIIGGDGGNGKTAGNGGTGVADKVNNDDGIGKVINGRNGEIIPADSGKPGSSPSGTSSTSKTPDPTVNVKGLNTTDHVAYIIGIGENKVNPLGTITRAEIANIYFRLMVDAFRNENWSTDNRFSDVPDNAWYTMAVLALDKAGVIIDSDDGRFRPNEPVTRAELAVMAAQFCTITGKIPATTFKDVPADYWAADEIALIEYAGWIEGYAGNFCPDDNLSRAEAMTIINRMLQRGAEDENMLEDMIIWADNADTSQWYFEAVQEATNSHSYTRTNVLLMGEKFCGERWTALLEATDWSAMERA